MLSNLSSFISEKLDKLDLHGHLDREPSPQPRHNGRPAEDDQPSQRRDTADGPKKEKRKKVSSNEAFIIVRPPPAKNNHPLNLQIQLVPAQHSRDRSNTSATATPTNSRISGDFSAQGDAVVAAAVVAGAASPAQQPPPSPSTSASETDHQQQQQQQGTADGGPRRSPSLRSNRSDTSTAFYASASSAGSVSSFASTASSTASGRRMIIPLYNLSAHNVMTNTVLDAGTDAKIAKFNKRGIEILNLAVLEPAEVWSGDPDAAALLRSVQRKASALSLAPPLPSHHGHHNGRAQDQHSQHSPSSSRLSLSSEHSSIRSEPPAAATPSSSPQQPTGARKLFGRVFRRKEGSSGSGGGGGHTPTLSDSSPTPTQTPALTPAPTLALPITTVEPPTPSVTRTTTTTSREERRQQQQRQQQPDLVLLPAVLGLTPTSANAMLPPPGGRCVAHVWVVRRWLKTEAQGLFSGVVAKISREVSSSSSSAAVGAAEDASLPPGAGAAWDVRFEWVRGKSKRATASASAAAAAAAATATPRVDDGSMGRRSSRTSSRRSSALVNVDEEQQQQQQGGPPHVRLSIDGGSATGEPLDMGDESDPEDSETPWTCTLVLSHPSNRPAAVMTPGGSAKAGGSHSRRGSAVQQGNGHLRTESSSVGGVPAWTEFGLDEAQAQMLPPPPQETRIKIATLSPAPHHPKVVGQLRVPFPLPDVEVESGTVRKRVVTPDGGTRSTVPPPPPPPPSQAQGRAGRLGLGVVGHLGGGSGSGGGGGGAGLVLTAEEIKDVVCCTAFWVVVRQSFGGIGKKTRKGDGWRIRA